MFIKENNSEQQLPMFLLLIKVVFAVYILSGCQPLHVDSSSEKLPLAEGLGKHHYPVTTSQPLTQRYFDQGLIQAYGFNHAEAARSFREAYRIDPNCALCYWGEALVLGPNINMPMDPSVVPQAYELVQKSITLADSSSDKEQALINALSKRYSKKAVEDRSSLDVAYADSMREVTERFPDDAVIASLTAEALMDVHPWDFWSKQGEAKTWTAEIVSTLEHAMALDVENPLANHLYIHVLEASPYAEKALPSAKRLISLVPGSGHLVHMPAHIYIRIGRYLDAVLVNQDAVKVDQKYLNHNHTESLYTLAYVPHNHHFLWAAAIKIGRKPLAEQAASDTAARVNKDMLRTPGFSGTLQHFYSIPLYTKVLFGDWDVILKQPAPATDLVYPTAVWHYARGLALLRQDQPDEAKLELEKLEQIIADPAISDLTVFDLNPVSSLLQIGADILRGEFAWHNKDFDAAQSYLQHAIELEDGLNYTEPKDWYLPPRQVLGAVLMEAGKAKSAEQVYRQDLQYHPQNGWSLFGLLQSLSEQGKNSEADVVKKQFEAVWADSDVKLTGSRF